MSKPEAGGALSDKRPDTTHAFLRAAIFLATLITATMLTYGWAALTGQSGLVSGSSFAVRAALSAAVVFSGAYVLTGLRSRLSGAVTDSAAPAAVENIAVENIAVENVAVENGATATPSASEHAGAASDTQAAHDDQPEPAPIHRPVRAADLPRILFDTGELPAITTLKKHPTTPPVRAIRPPVAWPHEPASQDPD